MAAGLQGAGGARTWAPELTAPLRSDEAWPGVALVGCPGLGGEGGEEGRTEEEPGAPSLSRDRPPHT